MLGQRCNANSVGFVLIGQVSKLLGTTAKWFLIMQVKGVWHRICETATYSNRGMEMCKRLAVHYCCLPWL